MLHQSTKRCCRDQDHHQAGARAFVAHAAWQLFVVYSAHYRFKDAVSPRPVPRPHDVRHAAARPEFSSSRTSSMCVTDENLTISGWRITRFVRRRIPGAEFLPGFTYQWPFTLKATRSSSPDHNSASPRRLFERRIGHAKWFRSVPYRRTRFVGDALDVVSMFSRAPRPPARAAPRRRRRRWRPRGGRAPRSFWRDRGARREPHDAECTSVAE